MHPEAFVILPRPFQVLLFLGDLKLVLSLLHSIHDLLGLQVTLRLLQRGLAPFQIQLSAFDLHLRLVRHLLKVDLRQPHRGLPILDHTFQSRGPLPLPSQRLLQFSLRILKRRLCIHNVLVVLLPVKLDHQVPHLHLLPFRPKLDDLQPTTTTMNPGSPDVLSACGPKLSGLRDRDV